MGDNFAMRVIPLAFVGALALGACHKPASSANPAATASPAAAPAPAAATGGLPTRRAGLWVETMTRDGKSSPMGGSIKICIDAATDAKMNSFGRQMGKSVCTQQSVTRGLDGSYHFSATCAVGHAGTIVSNGTASGDFSSKYVVHDESTVSGARFAPMNGRHVTEIAATYQGPCPPDMIPGDMVMASGMKMNINQMPQAGPLKAP